MPTIPTNKLKKELENYKYQNILKSLGITKISLQDTENIDEYLTAKIQMLRKARATNRKIRNQLWNKIIEMNSINTDQ